MTDDERWTLFRRVVAVKGQAQVARDLGIAASIIHRVFNGRTPGSIARVLARVEYVYVKKGCPIKKVPRKSPRQSMRAMAWNSARIKRRFSIPELAVTIPIGDPHRRLDNLYPWARQMWIHGVFSMAGTPGSSTGVYKAYRLARHHDSPIQPIECVRCGKSIQGAKKCVPEVDENE